MPAKLRSVESRPVLHGKNGYLSLWKQLYYLRRTANWVIPAINEYTNEQYPGFSWHTVPFWGVNTRFIYTPTYGKRCKFRTWKSSVTSNRVQANSTAPQAFHTPGVKLCPGYLMASQTVSDPTLWCWKQEEWVLKSPRFSVRNIWSAYCFSWTTQCTSTEDELPFKKMGNMLPATV